jgi:hypothetical protein
MNLHAERSAGWSVLCFIGLIIIAAGLLGPLPDITTSPSAQAAYMSAHRSALLWSAWVTFPAAAFFLWFLVGLRSFLREAPGRQEGLAGFAFAAGIVVVTVALLTAFLQTALAYVLPSLYVADGLSAVYVTFILFTSGLGWAPVSIFLFAAAHSMRRHGSAPDALALLGYFAAFTSAVASFSIFFTNSSLSPTGLTTDVLGALPALIWLIGTGFTLIRIKERPAPS